MNTIINIYLKREQLYIVPQTDDNPTQALARFRQNEITKEEMLAEFRKPYSFKQLTIHNQSFCDIMKIEKVYQSKTGEELQKWQ